MTKTHIKTTPAVRRFNAAVESFDSLVGEHAHKMSVPEMVDLCQRWAMAVGPVEARQWRELANELQAANEGEESKDQNKNKMKTLTQKQAVRFAAAEAKLPAGYSYNLHDTNEALRAKHVAPEKSEYDTQAEKFLAANKIKFRATLADSKPAPWRDGNKESGHHYRVTLSKAKQIGGSIAYDVLKSGRVIDTVFYSGKQDCADVLKSLQNHDGVACDAVRQVRPRGEKLAFDFWGSVADQRAGKTQISAYSVLACISCDSFCPDTFADFCGEYGYEQDSIKALQTFKRASKFAARLKAFFTPEELEQLAEIR